MTFQSKEKLIPQNPIILRCHRLMEAFAKSDDERTFYLDRVEGFIVFFDLDKSQEELDAFLTEKEAHNDRYVEIPKLTFYEIKKLMEGFVNEKVYDIDTKEKLLDIIQSKNARDNFLEFIYDHHMELEKWQQYYQEKFRVRMIEWLRNQSFDFVFEEDVELTKSIVEKVKINMFTPKAAKEIVQARKILAAKAATYYSNEALNPRPKRGRPPKQIAKVETEPQFSQDIYIAVPKNIKPLLFTPDYHSSSVLFTFSDKFASEADLLAHRRQQLEHGHEDGSLKDKLQAIRSLSFGWGQGDEAAQGETSPAVRETFDEEEDYSSTSPQKEKKTSVQRQRSLPPSKKKSAPTLNVSKQKATSEKVKTPKKEPVSTKKSTPKVRLRPLVRKVRKKG